MQDDAPADETFLKRLLVLAILMPSQCSWCKNEILTKPEDRNASEKDLCLDCLLTFIAGDRPDRRRGERRRYTSNPEVERRSRTDRRRDPR
jgi:hypothetical protein